MTIIFIGAAGSRVVTGMNTSQNSPLSSILCVILTAVYRWPPKSRGHQFKCQTSRFSHSISRWAESFTRTSDQPPFRPLTSASYLSSVIDVFAGDNFGESIRGLAAQTHRKENRLSEAQQVVSARERPE